MHQRGSLPPLPATNKSGRVSVGLARRFPDMTEDEINNIVATFQKFDLDGNGRLDKNEFVLVVEEMKKTGKVKGAADRMLMDFHFDAMDKDHSGGIDIEEFIAGYNSLFHEERNELAQQLHSLHPELDVKQIENVLQAFEKFDKDGDGVIDAEEFYQLKEELMPQVSKVLLRLHTEKKFGRLDGDASGDLTRAELVAAYQDIFGSRAGLSPRVGDIPADAVRAFEDFATCDTLLATRQRFNELKEVCRAADGGAVYEAVRERLFGHPRWKPFFQLLDKLRKQKEYSIKSSVNPRVLIVGAGPAGLRMAIEAALLGTQVTIVEKRSKFSRHNLLHIWDSSIRDLKNIGAKYFYPQLCTGGINHVAIRKLQLVLLKIGLLLGVHLVHGSYVRSQQQQSGGLWKAEVQTQERHDEDRFLFNVLIGGEGANSGIAREFGFEKKTFKGSDAIGITANFVNTQTQDEKRLTEFGLLSVYNQPFFAKFKTAHDIELENLVYYRGETHYFVMTAKRPSLLRKGVVKEDRPVETLLAPDNLDRNKLEEFVRQVATLTGLPAGCEWVKSKRGVNDVAIFDFSKKQVCTSPAKIVHGSGGARLLVGIVGDALVEPFWPQGTGANRAFLSCFDLAWAIKGLFERGATAADEAKLVAEWNADFKTMATASPADLNPNMGAHTIDPRTRYKKASLGRFH